MACTYFRVLFLACDGRRRGDPNVQSGDYCAIYRVLENHSLDANWRDVTHDLQSIVMKLCYVKLSEAEVIQLYDVILEKDPDLNLLFHI